MILPMATRIIYSLPGLSCGVFFGYTLVNPIPAIPTTFFILSGLIALFHSDLLPLWYSFVAYSFAITTIYFGI